MSDRKSDAPSYVRREEGVSAGKPPAIGYIVWGGLLMLAILLVACVGVIGLGGSVAVPLVPGPQPPLLEDLDPDPMVFEGEIVAGAATWSIGSQDISGFAYNGSVPGPVIRVPLGARVKIHFLSDLGEHAGIHWHGIEGNNASDGTPTTQQPIVPGVPFDYNFVVTRPGLYWYHPHAHGAQGVFDGLYGVLIVDDPDEPALIASGVLPSDERILVLSDISEQDGVPWSVEVDNAMEIMNGTEGKHLLVNGKEDPVFQVPAGGAVRLRVVNTSITRFWRLSVPGATLYRVGGQGGLLDKTRVEGGTVPGQQKRLSTGEDLGPVDVSLGYEKGQILLAPAERADLVLVASGVPGQTLALRWEDFARGRHGMWMENDVMVMDDAPDDGLRTGEQVATFALVDSPTTPWKGSEGSPVLASLGRAVEVVPGDGALDWTGSKAMVFSEDMDMVQDATGVWDMTMALYVDGQSWMPDHDLGPEQPIAPTAVYAHIGDTLDWELRNESHMTHPVHLHGFSYQPLYFQKTDVENDTVTTWYPGFAEFEDTTILPGETSLFMRMRLDDPVGDGGAAGRWMRHCHILQHGESGMMSELIVSP